MSEPATAQNQSNAPVVLRIVLAVLCIVPGVIGLLMLGVVAAAFAYEGLHFPDVDNDLMQAFIIGAAMLIAPSIIVLGIILRYARWTKAPTASLVLSVIYLVTDIIGAGMLERTLDPGDTNNRHMLLFWASFGLLIGALPPFLHWWKSRG